MMGSELMLIVAFVCMLGLPLLLLGGLYAGVRAWRPRGEGLGKARGILNQRFARGEIDAEEYYERESALRSAEPITRKRAKI